MRRGDVLVKGSLPKGSHCEPLAMKREGSGSPAWEGNGLQAESPSQIWHCSWRVISEKLQSCNCLIGLIEALSVTVSSLSFATFPQLMGRE